MLLGKKILIIVLLLSFKQLLVFGSSSNEYQDSVKVKLLIGKEPIIGATFYIKDKNIILGTSDLYGEVILYISKKEKKVNISILGPYIELKIERPVDFVIFDLDTKKATYYFKNKKIKTKRQLIKR